MTDSRDAISRSSSRREERLVYVPLAGALVAALVMSGVMIVAATQEAEPTPVARPVATATPTPTPSPTTDSPCANPATESFRPTRITVQGVIRNAKVLALPRDSRNVPLVPPVAAVGKTQVAWDRPPGIKPGSPKGNVLLNAHTWPDGSALGNKMLKRLDKGDRIILRGDDATLCYEVDERIDVRASEGYPPYYDREGPPKIAFLVCSGKRLGPGEWTHRTIWFASPVEA
jgi:hypothetical protein